MIDSRRVLGYNIKGMSGVPKNRRAWQINTERIEGNGSNQKDDYW